MVGEVDMTIAPGASATAGRDVDYRIHPGVRAALVRQKPLRTTPVPPWTKPR